MILLLDEQLDSPDMVVARSLDVLGEAHSCSFRSLRTEAAGLKDPMIPGYCRAHGIDALVSANFRDFGAKEAIYAALLAAGVSVVVIRPQVKKSLLVEGQVSLLSKHLKRIGRELADAQAAGECILLRVNESGCVHRTLDELRAEISGEGKLP